MTRLSYVTHYYCDKSLALIDRLFQTYLTYAPDLLDQVEFVVVDDGSPLRWQPPSGLNLRLYRITENIPWNLAAARNLGVVQAQADTVFITDIDHIVPEKTLSYLVKRGVRRRHLVRFYRKTPGGDQLCNPHASTFLLSRSRFLTLHGYDEEFCGHYGYEETMFFRWQRLNGTLCYRAPKRYYIEMAQENEHSLQRDLLRNKLLAKKKRWQWDTYGPASGHSRLFSTSGYELGFASKRGGKLPLRPLWSRLWPLRSYLPFIG